MTGPAATKRLGLLLFLSLFFTYSYFYQSGDWNQNSRFDQARALVTGHLAIDAYHLNTGDKAFFAGHYYSDKAPGTALVATIPVAFLRALRPFLPAALASGHASNVLASYLAVLLASGLATAMTALLLFHLAIRLGASPRAATLIGASFGLGSIAFPFATVLFGHALASALLFTSFCLVVRDRLDDRRRLPWLAGLLGGAAIITEFTTAGAVLIVGIGAAWRERRFVARRFAAFSLGVLPAALLVGAVGKIAYHNPWDLGSRHLAEFADFLPGHGQDYVFSYPKPAVLRELFFLPYRGLFLHAPELLLATLGLWRVRRQPLWGVTLGVLAYYVLSQASFAWWYAGSSFGPRHLIPMLPFLCLGAIAIVDRWPRLFLGATAIASLVMVIAAATTPLPGREIEVPFRWMLSLVGRGELGAAPMCVDAISVPHHTALYGRPSDATNLGLLAGLRGAWSLLPLLACWALCGYVLWSVARGVKGASPPARASRPPTTAP